MTTRLQRSCRRLNSWISDARMPCAICPGAVAWRVDPGSYTLWQLSGAAIMMALDNLNASGLYAICTTGAELGPITIMTVASTAIGGCWSGLYCQFIGFDECNQYIKVIAFHTIRLGRIIKKRRNRC